MCAEHRGSRETPGGEPPGYVLKDGKPPSPTSPEGLSSEHAEFTPVPVMCTGTRGPRESPGGESPGYALKDAKDE